ncbi:MAG: Wzz/FepE/Etk N-terminal domain-containing protein [Syntrophales bacterium]
MQNILREFVFILFYRSRLIVVVFLTVFILSAVFAVTLPSIYRSTAKFSLVIPQSLDPLQQESSADYRNRVRRFLQDQKELITSNRVLTKVVNEIYPGTNRQSAISAKINDLLANLDVVPPGGESAESSSVFIVEFSDHSPAFAAKVAQSVTDNYLATYREISQGKSDFSHTFFQEQTRKLQKDMEEKESKVRDFETKQALALLEILNLGENKGNAEVGPNALLTQFIGSYHALQTELAGLQVSIGSIEGELKKKGIPIVMPEMEVAGRSISVFKSKVAQLQIQLNEMKPQFKENFEPMKQVEQELNLSVDSLKNELKRSITAQKITAQSIRARIGQLEKIIRGLQERIQTIAQEKATYQNLLQQFNIAKEAYTRTQAQMEQARMAQSLTQDKQFLTLIDKPAVPVSPYKPNRIMLVVGGLISGIFLGIATALTVDHFDHRFKTIYEIETQLKVPVLGSMQNL